MEIEKKTTREFCEEHAKGRCKDFNKRWVSEDDYNKLKEEIKNLSCCYEHIVSECPLDELKQQITEPEDEVKEE